MTARLLVLLIIISIWLLEAAIIFRIENQRWRFGLKVLLIVTTIIAFAAWLATQLK